ncbi:MAG: CPBP family glutamic-type intramembrane protease [Candidatus Asgardarchaeia archaeon]
MDKNEFSEKYSDKIVCKVCGSLIDADAKYCYNCGKRMIAQKWKEIFTPVIVGVLALQGLAIIVFPTFLISAYLASHPTTQQEMYITTITALSFLNFFEIVLFLLVYWHFNDLTATLKWIGFDFSDKKIATRELAIGGVLGVILAIVMKNFAVAFLNEEVLAFDIPIGVLLLLFISTFFIGFSEEALFRGFTQTAFVYKFRHLSTGKILAVVVASIIFGLAHIKWPNIIITATIGLIIGIIYELFDERLYAPMALHSVYDFVIFAYPVFAFYFGI